jgi:predicted component of type VI protein secretion system
MQDGQAVLHDQSRYGTLLNGHRIEGSAVLQAGDVLSIGQPALDFDLIAEVGRGP